MIQIDLDGYQVPYICKKCSKCFATMKKSSEHQRRNHKKRLETKITINLALENFKLVSTKKIEVMTN